MVGQDNPELISPKILQQFLGILGVALPFILYLGNSIVFGDSELKGSMSAYYNTDMRDVFVGVLFAFGVTLIAYKGYEQKDHYLGIFAGVSAFGVALFGTPAEGVDDPAARISHGIFTIFFYGSLVLFSIWLFMKSHPDKQPTPMKEIRNRIYLISGIIMILSIIFIALTWLFELEILGGNATFWFETVANTAFGVSWFVKGGLIPALRDK